MSWTVEVESQVSSQRLFKAALVDWHNLGPKLLPELIHSASVLHGDGNVGSIRQYNFTSVMPFSYVKERLDHGDFDNLECKQTVIEGGFIGKTLETATWHYKLEPTSSGGTKVKIFATYKVLPGVTINEEEIEKAKESVIGIIKAAEAYLIANPDAYA